MSKVVSKEKEKRQTAETRGVKAESINESQTDLDTRQPRMPRKNLEWEKGTIAGGMPKLLRAKEKRRALKFAFVHFKIHATCLHAIRALRQISPEEGKINK